MDSGHEDIATTSHLTMPEAEWKQAQTQARIIAGLTEREKVEVVAADATVAVSFVWRPCRYSLYGSVDAGEETWRGPRSTGDELIKGRRRRR